MVAATIDCCINNALIRWKGTALSRAVKGQYETGFSPGSPRLKPSFTVRDFAGLKPGASTVG